MNLSRQDATLFFDLMWSLQYFVNYPDLVHHPMEDLVYRRLVERDPDIVSQVDDIVAEHDTMETRTLRFIGLIDRQEAAGADWRTEVAKQLEDFIEAYWRHLKIEEEMLFPRAFQRLTIADWAEIEAAVDPRVDPLFGDAVEGQYQDLLDDILRAGA